MAPQMCVRPDASRAFAEGNTEDTPIIADADKAFKTLQAQFALRAHTLHRTSPADGPVSYLAERWGLSRYLPTLDDARRFLAQIGGDHVPN